MITFFKKPTNPLNNEKLEIMKLSLGENYINNKTIDFFTKYYKSLDIYKYFQIPLINITLALKYIF